MKSVVYGFVIVSVTISANIWGQELASEKCARDGYKQVARFHDILASLTTKALPEKNIKALEDAAATLDVAMADLKQMSYKTHHNAKFRRYKERREELGKEVDQYVQAAGSFDTTAILTLLPQVQERFEAACAELVPYPWPAFEQLRVAAKALSDSAKAQSEAIALKPAVDRVVAKVAALAQSPVPDSCQERATLIQDEITYFTKLSAKLGESLSRKDLVALRTQANELDVRLGTFELYYLQ